MFKLAVLLVVLLSVNLSKEEGPSSGQSGFITMKIAPAGK